MSRIAVLLPALAVSSTLFADLVPDVIQALSNNQTIVAERMIDAYKAQRGATPEMIEAYSWMSRAAMARRQYNDADRFAQETYLMANAQLTRQFGQLDKETHLPTALGAAIEVEAQLMVARGERDQAITYLRTQLKKYYATSIRVRIQKNINLLSLEGKPLPSLHLNDFLGSVGPPPMAAVALRGKPVFLFFWAHWCSDCKAEAPIIERLKGEYRAKGVVFLAPTQHYGYVAGGEDAPRAVETKYMEAVWHKYYAGLQDIPVPVSEENFKLFGSSTTPTLVLADRAGVVRMYHPGAMTEVELRAQLDAVVRR